MKIPGSKIGHTGAVMVAVSALFYLVDFIPVVSIISSVMYWLIWTFTLLHTNIKRLMHPKIIAIATCSFILGSVPFINWFPWDILGTYITFKIDPRQ